MIQVKPNLSEQQVCFCDEYLVSFNAFRAAINAGYSENTARKGEILHIPKVQEYLRLKMQQRGERLEITHDMILREYAKIAFSSMANYYDERGDLKPMRELTEVEKSAISHLKTTNIAEPDGYIVGAVTQIKLHNKMAALDKIARHLGFFEAKRVAGGELPVAGLEETQESIGKNHEEEVTVEGTQESIGKNHEEEVAVEGTQESRGKNQEVEKAAVVAKREFQDQTQVRAENLGDIAFGNECVIDPLTIVDSEILVEDVAETAGKILTLSPLYADRGDGVDGAADSDELLAVAH